MPRGEVIQLNFPSFEKHWDRNNYMIRSIIDHYSDRNQWAFIVELRTGTGYGHWSQKYIDLFAINCYPSKGNHKIAFEIKTSRSDFLNEMKKPLKRHPALMISNQFYFAAPKGMLKPDEIPQEAGLVEVGTEGEVVIKVAAPLREAYPPTWPLVASIARRVNQLDHQLRQMNERET